MRKPDGKRLLAGATRCWENNIKINHKKDRMGECGLDSYDWAYGSVADSGEHDDVVLAYIEGGIYDRLRNSQFLGDSAPMELINLKKSK